ncbi:MAG TPA: DUF87 domain-containing protein [Candidatus Sulfotelmatobacter sp.]|nr:DUF87 domain-containing protein [Candidatus Sulfotelmatobacter sp.]
MAETGLFASVSGEILGHGFVSVVINLILLFIILSFLFRALKNIRDKNQEKRSKRINLRLTPLAFDSKSVQDSAGLIETLLLSGNSYSFEVVGSKAGVSYEVNMPLKEKPSFIRSVKSYSEYVSVSEVDDPIGANQDFECYQLKLNNSFIYSLKDVSLEQSYLGGIFSNLSGEDKLILQLSAKYTEIAGLSRLLGKLKAKRRRHFVWFIQKPIEFTSVCLSSIWYLAYRYYCYVVNRPYLPRNLMTPGVSLSNGLNRAEIEEIDSKIKGKLFSVDIRMASYSSDPEMRERLKNDVLGALKKYESFYQHFDVKKLSSAEPLRHRYNDHRGVYLSGKEIAYLYNPLDVNLSSYSQRKLSSPVLPLPLGLKGRKYDLKVGDNVFDGVEPFGLTNEERKRHVYIVGGTGSGKSTLIKSLAIQDIDAGRGLLVIDPHGDLAEEVLARVPKKRKKDLIYFNPSDISHPMHINLMELDNDLSGDEKLLAEDLITEQIVSIFRKLFSGDDSGGNRLEHILRNAIATAFYIEDATIFSVYRLLVDNRFRGNVLKKVQDKTLLAFWENEYASAGSMQRVKLSIGITSKIGRFLRSAVTRRILGQPKSSIDFLGVINSGKILICNLSKGKIGEDTSALLGSIVLAEVQLAAYRRASLKASQRTDFFVYVDEFQNFATNSFLKMLSEARKYGVYLTMAEQSLSQQTRSYISNVLANSGTVIAFKLASPDDERLILPLFEPYLARGNLLSQPAFNFYVRVSAINPLEPTSGQTSL